MSFLFGGAPKVKRDPEKDHLRELRHATRSMDREDIKAAAQEKSLVSSITKLAKEQKVDLCKVKAKELIRLRSHRQRLMTMKGHMTALGQQLQTVGSARIIQESVAKTSKILKCLNQRMDARGVHRMLLEFEGQNAAFADGQEIVEETLDGIFETDNEQAVTDKAVSEVLQELGLDLELQMGTPNVYLQGTESVETLESRLERLKT